MYPLRYQSTISVVHEGIDTDVVIPNDRAELELPNGMTVCAGNEVITYVARNLEPYRGFPIFMRSLVRVLAQRPQAQVVIVGGDEVS